MRARIWLLLWLLGLLFPAAALGRFSRTYQTAFTAIFGSEWVHIIMHTALYAILGVLITLTLRLPVNCRTALLVLSLILSIGMLQEGIQAISQGVDLLQVASLKRAAFDLAVDLMGGILGLSILSYNKSLYQSKQCTG